MPKVTNKIYWFEPSASPDVTGYMLYWENHVPGEVNSFAYTDNKVDLNTPPTRIEASGVTVHYVDLATLADFANMEAQINISVTAYDANGNESAFGALVEGALLDFQPPTAPGAGGVSDV